MINTTEKKSEHAKLINNVRNNGEKTQADQTNNGTKANKDSVIDEGDLVIKDVNGCDICLSHTVKFRHNPGVSVDDLMDYVKPVLNKKGTALLSRNIANVLKYI